MEPRISAGTHYDRGRIQKRLHMYRQAITDFQQAGEDPRYAGKAQVQIAMCYRAMGCLDEAIAAFRKAASAPAVTDEEHRHIQYHVGQLLETLGRHAESVEVYGRIRHEDAEFGDVTQRIRRIIASGGQARAQERGAWSRLRQRLPGGRRSLTPSFDGLFNQARQWLGQQVGHLPQDHPAQALTGLTHEVDKRSLPEARRPIPPKPPARRMRAAEQRRYSRVPVCLKSHFSVKRGEAAREGVLRDLSPWGCRIASFSSVAVGERLECWIYPQGAAHPFTIDGATVCWIKDREFGLSFTSVRPGVQKQLAQLCRTQAV